MLGLQPRREVWDYGLLPLHGLCPQLDGPNAVLRLHRALHALATVQPDGKREYVRFKCSCTSICYAITS